MSSTHGVGELPDNLQPLFKQISDRKADLSQVRYGGIDITEHYIPEDPAEI